MAAKERSERSGNFTTLKFQVVRTWNLANLTLEEIFPDSWFPVLLHLDFGYLDYWASTHINFVHPAESITSNTKNLHTLATP